MSVNINPTTLERKKKKKHQSNKNIRKLARPTPAYQDSKAKSQTPATKKPPKEVH